MSETLSLVFACLAGGYIGCLIGAIIGMLGKRFIKKEYVADGFGTMSIFCGFALLVQIIQFLILTVLYLTHSIQ